MERFLGRPLRRSRAAFWHLDADRLVAAVISRSDADEEPVLEACAASWATTSAASSFAPGIVEMAAVLGARSLLHVAALSSRYCRVESTLHAQGNVDADPGSTPEVGAWSSGVERPGASHASAPEAVAVIREAEGLRVHAPRAVVREAAGLFRDARLRLLALDCEPCALATLDEALGLACDPRGEDLVREARQASTASAATRHPAQAATRLRGAAATPGDGVGHPRRQALAAVSVLEDAVKAAEALGEQLAVPVGLAVAWFDGGRRAR